MRVVIIAAFFWAERSPRWASRAALFGAALLIKLAAFARHPCAVGARRALAGRVLAGGALALPPARALVWMALLGPLLFVALWPWLWHDTLERLGAYLAFHLRHYPILLFYDGEIWQQPFAPWHAPFVLGLGALPGTVLVLGVLGAGRAVRALWRLVRGADESGVAAAVSVADRLRALVALQAAFSIGIVASSTSRTAARVVHALLPAVVRAGCRRPALVMTPRGRAPPPTRCAPSRSCWRCPGSSAP